MTSEIRLDNARIEHLATPLKVSPIALAHGRSADGCGAELMKRRLAPIAGLGGSRIDLSAMAEIDRIPSETVVWRRGSEIHGPTRSAGGLISVSSSLLAATMIQKPPYLQTARWL